MNQTQPVSIMISLDQKIGIRFTSGISDDFKEVAFHAVFAFHKAQVSYSRWQRIGRRPPNRRSALAVVLILSLHCKAPACSGVF
jgi:hypothetical protein